MLSGCRFRCCMGIIDVSHAGDYAWRCLQGTQGGASDRQFFPGPAASMIKHNRALTETVRMTPGSARCSGSSDLEWPCVVLTPTVTRLIFCTFKF